MLSEGPRNPTNWGGELANPSNIAASDDANATNATTTNGAVNHIYAHDFGFAIPSGATIDGIEITIERKSTHNGASNYITDHHVRLTKSANIPSGDDQPSGDKWPTSDGVKSYGGVGDLWGTTWTSAEINNSGFGVRLDLIYQTDGTSVGSSVDHITVTVHYTAGGESNAFLQTMIGTP